MSSLLSKLGLVASAILLTDMAEAGPSRKSHNKLSPSLRKELEEADDYGRMSLTHDDPQVQITSYVFDNVWSFDLPSMAWQNMKLGVRFDVLADIFASFSAATFWLHRSGQDWMVFNPNIFIEASGLASMTIQLWVIEMTFTIKFLGYKITPFDLQWSWDLDKKKRSCYSVGLYQEIFDLSFEVEQNTNECYLGLVGFLLKGSNPTWNLDGCTWRRYKPREPFFQTTFLDKGDRAIDYIPYKCNDYAELETEEESISVENPTGFDSGKDPWEWDPGNVVID